MIPQAAIDDYLSRPLDAHTWVKRLNAKAVDSALARLDPPPQLHPELRLHQKACFLLGVAYPQFCFWLDMGCVDGDTEYLTPTGWNKIRNYKTGVVGQYDPHTKHVTFAQPLRFINQPCGKMFWFKTSRGLDQMVSPEHNMLVVATGHDPTSPKSRPSIWKHTPVAALPEYTSRSLRNPWFYRVSAQEMAEIKGQRHCSVETTFTHDGPGITLTDAQIRVQVAVHADGHLPNKSRAVIRVKKERKKVRIRMLLRKARIPWKERSYTEDYTSFVFTPPLHTKTYGPFWWQCSTEQKRVIADEVGHWDGSFGKANSVSFFTRSRSCAEFIQFCFVSTGRRAFLNPVLKPRQDGKRDYSVHAIETGRTTNLANLLGGIEVAPPDGRKYCFEVPTGYLVLRRNGNVFVTGNSGKSLLALELLRYWWKCNKLRRAIIFVTSDKAFPSWEAQFKRFDIRLPVTALSGPSVQKWQQLEEFGDGIVLLPYPGAVAMVSQRVPAKKRGKLKLKLDPKLVQRLAQWSQGFVLDESTRCGHHQSLTFKLVSKLQDAAFARYALAGRPFGRDPTMLWAQHFLIDGGETLGPTLGLFREAFFSAHEKKHARNKYAKDYKFKEKLKPQLSRIIQHRSIAYSADECIDLPKVTRMREVLGFPEEAQAYCRRVIQDIIEARGNLREMKNAFMRLRQISSGFLGLRDEETGERAEIEFLENPKLDRLLELLEDLPEKRKAVVFHDFTLSGRKITAQLKERGFNPIWLWSGTKNSGAEIRRFLQDPSTEVAVVNNRVGAYSLDGLQHVANYTFFYESPVSAIDREQAERRLIRDGQRHKVFQYDLVVQGTADERILAYHAEGKSLFDALLKNPSKALGLLP